MDWTANTDIGRLADEYGLILVMPDGGYNSWYIDSPVIAKSKFETYIGKEVVSYIDSHYRTVTSKGGRAITGLSMGGFGALNIAINNASTFGSAGSISGAVDPRSFWENWGLEGTFGDHLANANFWNEKAIINNADRFAENGINLTIDCGVDDFFVGSNRTLHQRLLVLNVPHDYTERPGGHTWAYWRNAIRYQVLFFSIKFEEGRGSLR
ncbi:putative tributyrin esterase (plasmid) [Caballeronia sp. S22]